MTPCRLERWRPLNLPCGRNSLYKETQRLALQSKKLFLLGQEMFCHLGGPGADPSPSKNNGEQMDDGAGRTGEGGGTVIGKLPAIRG